MTSSTHDLAFLSPARHFECHKQTKIRLQTQHFNVISHGDIKMLCWTAYFRLLMIPENTTGFITQQKGNRQWWITGGIAVEDFGDCVGREDHRNRAHSQPGTSNVSVAIQSRGRTLQHPGCGRYRSHARHPRSVIVSATKYVPGSDPTESQYMPTYTP
jgi:hypothetical protein